MSLIEVLAVVAIIAILAALLLPATRRVRGPAERMQCQNNLKNLMLGMHTYADTVGKPVPLPPSAGSTDPRTGRAFPTGCFGPGAAPEERLSWAVALLPYIEQESLFKQFDAEKGYAGNLAPAGTPVRTFLCAAGTEYGPITHYVALSGVGPAAAVRPAGAPGNGFMGYDRVIAAELMTDGTANTIALMETRSDLGPWARGGTSTVRGFDPADLPFSGDGRPFGGHPGGLNVAFADGSVRFITATTDPLKLAASVTVAGGEPGGLD
jgi:prepilin-type processing-associated H-X9-DG protein